jgi:hypothetical protein
MNDRVTLVMRGLTMRQARKIVDKQYGIVDWTEFDSKTILADPEDDNSDNRCEIILEKRADDNNG